MRIVLAALFSLIAFNSNASGLFLDNIGQSFNNHYGWKSAQIVSPSRAVTLGSGQPNNFINGAVKWTIQPGDDPLNNGSNRNEVLQINANGDDEDGNSGTRDYGYSLYLPKSSFSCPTSSPWFVVLQLHGPDVYGLSPAFSLDLCNWSKPGHYIIETNGGDVKNPIQKNIDLGPIVFDTRVDFLFRIFWAANNTGKVEIWTRTNNSGPLLARTVSLTNSGTPIAAVLTPTLYSANGVTLPHYFKRGIYRSPKQSTTVTIYAGPFSRAGNFQDAATAAFSQWP